jgi:hypothetical protein
MFSHNPGQTHWEAELLILRYIQGTKRLSLQLGGDMQYPKLFTYADSDYAADQTRRSRSGFIILLGKYPIIWSSKLQRCVALSSTEAEYVAVTAAARFTIWA